MAKGKRMFSSVITKQDSFLDMPLSAQALYFHLNLEADDEGFVDNIKSLMRQIRATEDDLKILLTKRYLLPFESGVLVIKHWLIHNTIRQDRIKETTYIEERESLDIKENMSYTEKREGLFKMGVIDMVVSDTVSDTMSDKCPPNNTNLIKPIIKEVIDYLNNKLNTKYKYTNTRTEAFLKARVAEGYTVQDFKDVIDLKYQQWFDKPDMRKYLRPETLFNKTKFESYINEVRMNGNGGGAVGADPTTVL